MTNVGARRGLPGLSFPEAYLKRLADDLATKFSGVVGAIHGSLRGGRYADP